jgi:hypothetical protein
MSGLENVSHNDDIWEFIKANPKMLGLPLSDNKGLDILSAMKDIHDTIIPNPEAAAEMLTLLAGVILATVQGDGEEVINEVIVAEAMHKFDTEAKDLLNE